MMFEDFWRQYPRKIAKKAALKAWEKLSPEQQQKALMTVSDHARKWRQENRTDDRMPHASTWLNGWRFDDEFPKDQMNGKFNPVQYVNRSFAEGMDASPAQEAEPDLYGKVH